MFAAHLHLQLQLPFLLRHREGRQTQTLGLEHRTGVQRQKEIGKVRHQRQTFPREPELRQWLHTRFPRRSEMCDQVSKGHVAVAQGLDHRVPDACQHGGEWLFARQRHPQRQGVHELPQHRALFAFRAASHWAGNHQVVVTAEPMQPRGVSSEQHHKGRGLLRFGQGMNPRAGHLAQAKGLAAALVLGVHGTGLVQRQAVDRRRRVQCVLPMGEPGLMLG